MSSPKNGNENKCGGRSNDNNRYAKYQKLILGFQYLEFQAAVAGLTRVLKSLFLFMVTTPKTS